LVFNNPTLAENTDGHLNPQDLHHATGHDHLEAQLAGAGARLAKITAEFEQTAPGADLSRSGRIETKEFISSIKFVLDQLTVGVWKNIVGRELTQEVAEKRLKDIYYPYATDAQMLRSSLGKMIDLKSLDAGNPTMRERMFADWLRSMQPPYAPAYEPLYMIGRLSRLPHQKLIDQRKTRLFAMEAFSANGGGVSMNSKISHLRLQFGHIETSTA